MGQYPEFSRFKAMNAYPINERSEVYAAIMSTYPFEISPSGRTLIGYVHYRGLRLKQDSNWESAEDRNMYLFGPAGQAARVVVYYREKDGRLEWALLPRFTIVEQKGIYGCSNEIIKELMLISVYDNQTSRILHEVRNSHEHHATRTSKAADWLDLHYPEWSNPLAYWDDCEPLEGWNPAVTLD